MAKNKDNFYHTTFMNHIIFSIQVILFFCIMIYISLWISHPFSYFKRSELVSSRPIEKFKYEQKFYVREDPSVNMANMKITTSQSRRQASTWIYIWELFYRKSNLDLRNKCRL